MNKNKLGPGLVTFTNYNIKYTIITITNMHAIIDACGFHIMYKSSIIIATSMGLWAYFFSFNSLQCKVDQIPLIFRKYVIYAVELQENFNVR